MRIARWGLQMRFCPRSRPHEEGFSPYYRVEIRGSGPYDLFKYGSWKVLCSGGRAAASVGGQGAKLAKWPNYPCAYLVIAENTGEMVN